MNTRFYSAVAMVLVSTFVISGQQTLRAGQRSAQGAPSRLERQIPDPETRRKRDNAYSAGGLRAAAAVTGSYREVISGHHGNNANTLDFLVQYSPVVVVGQILKNRTWLNATGRAITTDYEVFVDQSLKGDIRPGETLTVSILGGKVGFPDGSWAEVEIFDMLLPLNGERYVFFLRPTTHEPGPAQRKAAAGELYTTSFQSRSLYRISDRGVITPKTYSQHPLFKAYAGKPERALIDDVIATIQRQIGAGVR